MDYLDTKYNLLKVIFMFLGPVSSPKKKKIFKVLYWVEKLQLRLNNEAGYMYMFV